MVYPLSWSVHCCFDLALRRSIERCWQVGRSPRDAFADIDEDLVKILHRKASVRSTVSKSGVPKCEPFIWSVLDGNQNVPDTDWLQLLRLIVAPYRVRRRKKTAPAKAGAGKLDTMILLLSLLRPASKT
jgi:hypothetical protein